MRFPFAAFAVLAFVPAALPAGCPYPCWSEISPAKFTFNSFSEIPPTPASLPYLFSLPYPPQSTGAWTQACNARENPAVDLYKYDAAAKTWSGPLAGPVYRNPSAIEISGRAAGWKGIAVRAAFDGKAGRAGGSTLAQAVFFHDEPCYRASTEFGFDRYLKGAPSDDIVYFYYELHANCSPAGKCRASGTGEILVDRRDSVPVAAAGALNSQGGTDWLYEAYLIDGGARWYIRVEDPYRHRTRSPPMIHAVDDFYQPIARDYYTRGAEGYVTATSERSDPVSFTGEAPALNVVKIYAAK